MSDDLIGIIQVIGQVRENKGAIKAKHTGFLQSRWPQPFPKGHK